MGSREEVLEAENSRLRGEMTSMKKKISKALKKQQAELQEKIQAAEQRAAAAEATVANLSTQNTGNQEEFLKGDANGQVLDIRSELSKSKAALEDERKLRKEQETETSKEKEQLRTQLSQLRSMLEKEKNSSKMRLEKELDEANSDAEQRIQKLMEVNKSLEGQLLAAAKQVSEAFARTDSMYNQLQQVSKECNSVNAAYKSLMNEHEKTCIELNKVRNDADVKLQEMENRVASHKATQEGQEAAISRLIQQQQEMETSLVAGAKEAHDTHREELLVKLAERNSEIESLRGSLLAAEKQETNHILEDLRKMNESLTSELAEMKRVNEGLQAQHVPLSEGTVHVRQHELLQEILELKQQLQRSRAAAENMKEELSDGFAEATNKTKVLLEQNAADCRKLEDEIKQRDEKYAELDSKFNRLQKRAKQRIQELQKEKEEAELQSASILKREAEALSKQTAVQNELERFRIQAGDAIRALDAERQNLRNTISKFEKELENLKHSLDAKEHNLSESRKLASEKDQTALSMEANLKELEARHEAALVDLSEKNRKIVETLESQLVELALEKQKLAEAMSTLQVQLAERDSKLAEVDAARTGELARLAAIVEVAKGETARIESEYKNELEKWTATTASMEAKIQELEKAYQQAHLTAAERKRVSEAELDAQRQALADAQKETSLAKSETARLAKEFSAYKLRAHALLQRKESELEAAKDTELAAAQEAIIKDAQKQAACAAAERDRAVKAHKQAVDDYEIQLAARNVAVVEAEQRIRDLATKLESLRNLLSFERDERQKQSKELEESWSEKYQALVRQQQPAVDDTIKNEFSLLLIDYEQLKGEYESFKEMANRMIETKDHELAKLLEDNSNLQKSHQSLQENRKQGTTFEAEHDASASVLAVAEQQILILARQQAQREEEMKQCQRQIQVLQEEISDMEHENRLHRQQEALLKEEFRSMERAAKRDGVDMTYLKNVVLKLLQTGEVEALLPVIGMLLQFSPDEVRRCQEAYKAVAEDSSVTTPRSLLSRLSFSSSTK